MHTIFFLVIPEVNKVLKFTPFFFWVGKQCSLTAISQLFRHGMIFVPHWVHIWSWHVEHGEGDQVAPLMVLELMLGTDQNSLLS